MNITEAVERACKEETLTEALSWIAIWETDRVVRQAIKNTASTERNADGSLYNTCFAFCFKQVIEKFHRKGIEHQPIY